MSQGEAALCGDAKVHLELPWGQRREVGHPSRGAARRQRRGASPQQRSGVDFWRFTELEGSVSLWAFPGSITQKKKKKVPVLIRWPCSLSISQQQRLVRGGSWRLSSPSSEHTGESWESELVLSRGCEWTQTWRQGITPLTALSVYTALCPS